MVLAHINEIEVFVPKNTSILEACSIAGLDLPRFCYHNKLSIAGNCRMCLVELEKAPKPVASCAMPIGPNMRVLTETPLTFKARENVLEYILLNHPLDCPICDQGGECDLQDQSLKYGSDLFRMHLNRRSVEDKNCGPLIKTIMTRCIHCTRCVRYASEIAGVESFGTLNRGGSTEIGSYLERFFSSEISGNVIELCPVGALTSKPYAYRVRPWELRSVKAIDFLDSFGSNINYELSGTEIYRVLPIINKNINQEWLTDKARYSFDSQESMRIRHFLIRGYKFLDYTYEDVLKSIKLKKRINIEFFNFYSILIYFYSKYLVNLKNKKFLSFKINFFFNKKFFKHLNNKYSTFSLLNSLRASNKDGSIYNSQDSFTLINKWVSSNKTLFICNSSELNFSLNKYLERLEHTNKNIRFRSCSISNYKEGSYQIFNSSKINILNKADFCLLIGLNSRLESSILNIRLRSRLLKGGFNIYSLSTYCNSNLDCSFISLSLSFLVGLLEGKSPIIKEILQFSFIIFFFGSELKIKNFFPSVKRILESSFKSINFFYVPTNLGCTLESFLPIRSLSTNDIEWSQNIICLDPEENFHFSSVFGSIGSEYQSNFFSLKNLDSKKVIWLKSHGSDLAENYGSLIIPGKTYLESGFKSFNFEGRMQLSYEVIPYSSDCLSSKDFINLLIYNLTPFEKYSKSTFYIFNFDFFLKSVSYFENNNRFLDFINPFSKNYFYSLINFLPLKSNLEDPYLSNNYTSYSNIMGKCSFTYRNHKKNFLFV